MGVNASMMKAASRNPFPAPPENLKMSERESCSSFIILADADFSHDTACDSVLGLASACRPELENIALRHQIGVLQRSAGLFWICLSRLWRDWRSALVRGATRRGRKWMPFDDALTLLSDDLLVRRDILEGFRVGLGPAYGDVHLGGWAEAKVDAKVTLGEEIPAAAHFIDLAPAAGGHGNSRANRIAARGG